MIGGKIRTIPFPESQQVRSILLTLFVRCLVHFCGVTVVYDEIDDGIHDLLFKKCIGINDRGYHGSALLLQRTIRTCWRLLILNLCI